MTDYIRDLNNFIQSLQATQAFKWEFFQEGPVHAPTFTAYAIWENVEVARGQGGSKSAAKMQASKRALDFLHTRYAQ
ncbi:hypothetical protein FA95DRAFT_1566699 [Auriscalpium vulgare]|uniref:Uncharacterized protein n=1 Tax=Auriscalpium vulgare TaxID=40419 RepID=A0ACB8R8Y7_9AGAM|nr:hypothetical protein FA95DRAFT_1566699 [Auriscalpium vulgare]